MSVHVVSECQPVRELWERRALGLRAASPPRPAPPGLGGGGARLEPLGLGGGRGQRVGCAGLVSRSV